MEMEMEACLSRGDSSRLARALRDQGVSGSTLTQLGLLVHKQLSLADFGRVDVVLKALEILAEDRDLHETLVALGMAPQALSWFQTLRQHLTSRAPRSSAQLRPIEGFYDLFLALSRSPLPALELSLSLLELLLTLLESQLHYGVRLEAVRTFNVILDGLSRDQRRRVQSERMLLRTLPEVAAAIRTVGDYELQVSLSEALCRLTPRKERVQQAHQWFSCSEVAGAFSRIKDTDFEEDCRHFLNFLNNRQGDVRRVWTFPCIRAFLESTELFRPSDDKLDEFWVDFNFGSQCVSFFIDLPQGFLWGSVHLLKEEVESFQLQVQQDEGGALQAVLSVHLSVAITHLSCKGRRVRLLFRPELFEELEAATARVFAGDGEAASSSQVAAPTPTGLRVAIRPRLWLPPPSGRLIRGLVPAGSGAGLPPRLQAAGQILQEEAAPSTQSAPALVPEQRRRGLASHDSSKLGGRGL
ncbi:synaptonemal complex protein 2-like [Hippocampus zosterae]|uniref:synaptonemal complex protein 2-like n=1 Tax=Hippocampus zosterae TaxID=109293 RepID=UPI00223E1CAE|nr:synaptonemal complex protein 2-like [Hippocampus zosterae]